jgi:hypothetical protein
VHGDSNREAAAARPEAPCDRHVGWLMPSALDRAAVDQDVD